MLLCMTHELSTAHLRSPNQLLLSGDRAGVPNTSLWSRLAFSGVAAPLWVQINM